MYLVYTRQFLKYEPGAAPRLLSDNILDICKFAFETAQEKAVERVFVFKLIPGQKYGLKDSRASEDVPAKTIVLIVWQSEEKGPVHWDVYDSEVTACIAELQRKGEWK